MEVNFYRFPSGKSYTYIIKDGNPVFIRNILFIRNTEHPNDIAIVREWGSNTDVGVWEPPKGQMEQKEFNTTKSKIHLSLEELKSQMKKGVLREIVEEAKFLPAELKNLRMSPQHYEQAWKESGIPGARFMYQFWTADATPASMKRAQKRINELVKNSDWTNMLPHDVWEKDAIIWWNPKDGWNKIRGAFSKKMTRIYFNDIEAQ